MTEAPEPAVLEPPLPYEEMTDDKYSEHAARTFSVEQSGGGAITMRGACARCGHVMEYLIGDVVRAGWWQPASQISPLASSQEPEHMVCTCEGAHPSQPENFRGCGAFWDLAVSSS